VEGAELLALRGFGDRLRGETAPTVICEVTDSFLKQLGSSARELYAYMELQGYKFIYDCHNRRLSRLDVRREPDSLFQRNVLFAKAPLKF